MRSKNTNTEMSAVDLNRLLEVSTVQIGSILEEGSLSINKLTDEFSEIARALEEIRPMLEIDNAGDNALGIEKHLDKLSINVNQVLISFQFYDRLTQRLQHVIHGIDIISTGIKSRGCAGNWDDLYHKIRDSYTLSEEQSVFEVMMGKRDSDLVNNISNKQNVDLF